MGKEEGVALSLEARLEGLLFVAAAPVSVGQLAAALGVSRRVVEEGLLALEKQLQQRGIRLQEHRGRWQLTSAPELAAWVEALLGLETGGALSRAALETLAIIAYRQPITRPRIDAIRGVNSDGVIKSLLRKGLLEEVGREEGPGRPILYGTTTAFLQYFGLRSLADLPPLNLESESEQDVSLLKG